MFMLLFRNCFILCKWHYDKASIDCMVMWDYLKQFFYIVFSKINNISFEQFVQNNNKKYIHGG